ncbi:hypothetical protein [Solidesulfovibrio alcoholivorans]|uniref:hypothetical protein n=1 Tax=Solidesulfovibrio alcoholivorans TaxID=81406 RepID=UPI000495BEA9|nr:hypothetical protein [Solidesulfovibrio alcoholivorans]
MIVSRLDALEDRLQEAARRRDAQGLAMAALDLDDALRRLGRRLESLLGCLETQPGMTGRQDWGLGEISRKSLELLTYKHSFSLWRRWEQPLRRAYLELGRQSFSRGRFETARILLGQALAAAPMLPLRAEEAALLGPTPRLRPRRCRSFAAWLPPEGEVSSIARHPADGGYLVLDHMLGRVLRLDASLEPRETRALPPGKYWTLCADRDHPEGGLIWACDFQGQRLLGLDARGDAVASLSLSGLPVARGGQTRPIIAAAAAGWLYIVADVPGNPTLLVRLRPEDPAGTVEAFAHPWCQAAFGVHCAGDVLLTLHWKPAALLVFKMDSAGRGRLAHRLLLPGHLPSDPLSCCRGLGQTVVTTANSLLRFDEEFHPVYCHDQQIGVPPDFQQAFQRFCPDGAGGLVALDRIRHHIWQVTP